MKSNELISHINLSINVILGHKVSFGPATKRPGERLP